VAKAVAIAAKRPVLVDMIGARGALFNIALIAGGVVLTAAAAQLYIPMWPVPITGQTFAVLLVGATLGAWRAGVSMAAYVVLGGLGLPIFTEQSSGWSVIAGPTGGYLIGFILASILVGWMAQLRWDRSFLRAPLTFLAGTVVMYAAGLPWLSVALGQLGYPNSLQDTLTAGLYPFIVGDVLKMVLAGVLLPVTWKFINRTK